MKKLFSGENLISEMSDYFNFLSSNAMSDTGLWTSPYLDAGGLGVMVTHAIPIISKKYHELVSQPSYKTFKSVSGLFLLAFIIVVHVLCVICHLCTDTKHRCVFV